MIYNPETRKTVIKDGDIGQEYKNKRILVMGLGLLGGGIQTVKFLAKRGARLTVTDLRTPLELKSALRALNKTKYVRYILGQHRKNDFINADLIVKNPGVKPDSPFLKIAQEHHVPIISDVGIFFKYCPGNIIGVTGTRGKSTTAYLIWKFLKEGSGKKSSPNFFLVGNIRKPVLEFLPMVRSKDWVVMELSSFQLHDLAPEKQSPEIAVITNILPDHLNWHKDFIHYLRSKSYIFSFQKKNNYIFVGSEDRICRQVVKKARAKIILVSHRLPKKIEKVVIQNLGRHHLNSVALAVAIAKHFKVGDEKIFRVLKNFNGLEGRQEVIKTAKGITWINDTTSTMPEATIAALDRFENLAKKTQGRLILIAGGQDKKLDFNKMAAKIKKLVSTLIVLPGTATDKLKKDLKKTGFKDKNIIETNSMLKAVTEARRLAQKKDFIVFSPGAASFGLFNNEFDRGKKFMEAVKK